MGDYPAPEYHVEEQKMSSKSMQIHECQRDLNFLLNFKQLPVNKFQHELIFDLTIIQMSNDQGHN